MPNVRIPKQKRALDKRNKIIESGFNLICEKGYYNINTKDIALKAGVSTGILYQYFNDKHEIFLEGLKKYADNIFYPSINLKNTDIETNIKKTIEFFIKEHKLSNKAHEEIMAMVHLDKDVANFYHEREMNLTKNMYESLVSLGFSKENLLEKVHITLGLIDNLCHEIIYHKHKELDYDVMTDIVIKTIKKILSD